MDFEDEINHLAGETLALSLLLSAVLKGMSDADPVQSGPVIWTAFEKAFRVLDVSVEKFRRPKPCASEKRLSNPRTNSRGRVSDEGSRL